MAKQEPDLIGDQCPGGAFCSNEFDGDTSRIIDWNK
jgi:uronate dehydrogenase